MVNKADINMNAKNKKHLGKKLKKNVETELITDCQYQLELAQEKIMRLQLDVEKFNNSKKPDKINKYTFDNKINI